MKSQLSRPRCARLGESFDTEGRATASAAPGVEGWSACARPARNPTVRRFTSAREGREGRARPQGERARPDCGRCSAPARRRGHRIWRVQTGDSRGKASMGGGSGIGGGAGTANSPPPFKANPMHIKYRAYTTGDDPNVDLKVRAVCQAALSRVLPSARRIFVRARSSRGSRRPHRATEPIATRLPTPRARASSFPLPRSSPRARVADRDISKIHSPRRKPPRSTSGTWRIPRTN